MFRRKANAKGDRLQGEILMKIDIGVDEMIRVLEKEEKEQDRIIQKSRELIRHCSVAIKCIHSKEIKEAKAHIAAVDKELKGLKSEKFGYMLEQTYQEVCEAKVLMAVIEKKKVPTYKQLGIPFETYLLGLCDCVGELRREMLEQLKEGRKKEAKYYFEVMSHIYEAMIPIRFSASLLPNFRKKQDVARMQVEHARSELMRALS